jgi:hypothetical protein
VAQGGSAGSRLPPLVLRPKCTLPVYLVERDLPGITMDQLAAIQRAAIDTSQRVTAEGKPIRYIHSMYVPDESHCLCVFEAPTRRRSRR